MARQTGDSSASGWDIGLRLLYRDCPDQIGTVGRYDIDRRDCVLCQFVEFVTFALCVFIFALRNIALGGFFFATTGGMGRHATSQYKRIASVSLVHNTSQ